VGVPLAGDMESLNVAVAGSILMYALRDEKKIIQKKNRKVK
jgi:tRNA G18 (ribose-2'-O)-methylase SpoU